MQGKPCPLTDKVRGLRLGRWRAGGLGARDSARRHPRPDPARFAPWSPARRHNVVQRRALTAHSAPMTRPSSPLAGILPILAALAFPALPACSDGPTPAAGCAALAQARCARREACDPQGFTLAFRDSAACE